MAKLKAGCCPPSGRGTGAWCSGKCPSHPLGPGSLGPGDEGDWRGLTGGGARAPLEQTGPSGTAEKHRVQGSELRA